MCGHIGQTEPDNLESELESSASGRGLLNIRDKNLVCGPRAILHCTEKETQKDRLWQERKHNAGMKRNTDENSCPGLSAVF